MSEIIVVDENDLVVGQGEYREVRRSGKHHRITAVVLFNSKKEILLQLRSQFVHEAPGKWDISASGHVDAGDDYYDAATKELREELGVEGVELVSLGKSFEEYRQGDEWVRRHSVTYMASWDDELVVEPEEVEAIKWVSVAELRKWIIESPEDLTRGLKIIFDSYIAPMEQQ